MDANFVLREKEFIKENQQLELKTKQLLGQVEDAMKIQEKFFLKQDEARPTSNEKRCAFSHLPQSGKIHSKELNLPGCVDEMGAKGMLQFYKAKIKAVQGDLDKLQSELKHKTDELNKTQKNYQVSSEEREKWFLQYNLEKTNNSKLEKQLNAANTKLQLKETENVSLRKEVEKLKIDLKNTANDLSASENRLQRAVQEVEKTRTLLKTLRQDEKETKDAYRNNLKDLTATVKQIQKHKSELLNGYKKQVQLIDILKKQKAHVENAKVLEIAEIDFMKLLDWKLD